MIVYEPQPRWLPDIARLPLSYALRRALYGTFSMAAYAALFAFGVGLFSNVQIPHGAAVFSILGGATSVAVAFRLNNAYARW